MTTSSPESKELVVVAHNLPQARVENLLSKYGDMLLKAKETVKKASSIKVKDENDIDSMKEARKVRLELKDIRVHVENIRVELKEDSLREGKAIDGMANIIKAILEPVEKYLETQEKFAEVQKLEKEENEFQRRINELTPYVSDVTVYTLHPTQMSTETFNKLLEDSKKASDAQKAAEKRAEEEKIAKEKADAIENARIRKENERLTKLNEAKNAKLKAEREKTEAAELKLKQEKEGQERKEREAKVIEDARIKAEEEAKKKAEFAPDIDKMRVLYADMRSITEKINLMKLGTPKARSIVENAKSGLEKVMADMAQEIKSL